MQTSLRNLQAALTSARMAGKIAADADVQLTGLTTDSRQLQAGDLFLALRGEQFDAHDFLGTLAAKGAVAVVAEHVPAGRGRETALRGQRRPRPPAAITRRP